MSIPAAPQLEAGAVAPRWTWQWVVVLLFFFVVAELATRVEDRITNRVPLASRVAGPGDLVWFDTAGARGRPNATYRSWQLNSQGFRGRELSTDGRPRVFIVGSSETFGLYETRGQEYPRQLEDSLRTRVAAACGRASSFEVVNAALPGMAIPSMQQVLEKVVAPARPNVVVLYPSPGFYLNARTPEPTRGTAGADSTLPVRNAWRSRFRERVVSQVKSLLPAPVMTLLRRTVNERRQLTRFASLPPERVAAYGSHLRHLVGSAKRLGVPVVLVNHVNATMVPDFDDPAMLVAWEYQFPYATGQMLMDIHKAARDSTRQVAMDSALTYVDLATAFVRGWEGRFADFTHFTNIGASEVAGTLADAIAPVLGCGESHAR